MTAREAAEALRGLDRETHGAFRLAMELLVHFAGLPDVERAPVEPVRFPARRDGSSVNQRKPWTDERRARFNATMAAKRKAGGL